MIVIPVEATAAALVLSTWVPACRSGCSRCIVTALLTGTNLVSVGNYGEFEFWFALIKVVAIVGVHRRRAARDLRHAARLRGVGGRADLYDDGGFMPEGFGAVLTAMLITMFTFMGTEIVTIAAAESADPAKGIRRAVNSVIWRISLFYLGSIFVVVSLVSWQDPRLIDGSFQAALDVMNHLLPA